MGKPKGSLKQPLSFGIETYRDGALQRIGDARILKDEERFSLCMYSGGVAVEGMLRALCCIQSKEFDERHDLRKLAVRVRDLRLLKSERDPDFVSLVNKVARKWQNTMRFSSDAQVRRFLLNIGVYGVRKPTMKYISTEFFNDCSRIVRRCEVLWQRSHKKN